MNCVSFYLLYATCKLALSATIGCRQIWEMIGKVYRKLFKPKHSIKKALNIGICISQFLTALPIGILAFVSVTLFVVESLVRNIDYERATEDMIMALITEAEEEAFIK